MKKLISLFTTLCIAFSMLGTFTVFADNTAPSGHSINAYVTSRSLYGHWENTPIKVFSRQELNDCLIAIFGEYAPEFEQYDEEFFKDKFLYLAFLTSGNPKKINVTSISEGTNMIVIKTALEYTDVVEEYRENFVVAEIDKRLYDREITVSLTDLTEYDITYYEGAINDIQLENYTPCIEFITSSYQLKNCTDNTNFQSKYKDVDFSKDCLMLVAWNEPHQVRTRSIANVEFLKFDYANQCSYYRITLSETEPSEEYPEVVTPYFAVIQVSKYLQYGNFDIQIKNMYSTNDYIYEINNLNDLVKFRDTVNAGYNYENTTVNLNTDIDLSSVCGENINGENVSWTPIGLENFCSFKGEFNGNGHTIKNVYYYNDNKETGLEAVGLFGVNNGTIKNLGVNASITHLYYSMAGGIAADSGGIIENCYFSGTITSSAHVGGIVGVNNGQVKNCYNTGTIKGFHCIGGIVGTDSGGNEITNSYNVGNIIDMTPEDEEWRNPYFGSITGSGGEEVVNCYYLIGTYDKGVCTGDYGEGVADPTIALTTEQFADETNFTDWDFNTIWEMDATLGRPVLRSGTEEPPIETHIHKICGDANCTDNHEDIEWTAWDSTDTLPTEAGNYYLTKDVTITDDWFGQSEPVNLCLNGHVITTREGGLTIDNDVILTDCSDKVHRFTPDKDGIWVIDEQNGIKTLSGGIVTGFADAHTVLSLIEISEGAMLDMYNINITGNRPAGYSVSAFNGAGVTVNYDSTFNMHSGKIIGNGAGVFNTNTGKFNMTGGEITDNVAHEGVRLVYGDELGTMTIGGTAVIKDNKLNVLVNGNNISLDTDNPLTDGAYIGITSATVPTEENPVDITGANDADYSKYFHSDNENYKIVNGENNVIQLVVNADKIKPYMSRMFFSDNNIQSEKVTSLNQLKELVYEQCDYDGIAEKYDEAFFNDKFLYLYHIDDGSSGNVYNITSAENAENSINIAVTQEAEGDTDDIVQWFLVVEIDNDLYNKDININFTDLQQIDYNIKYENEKAIVTVPQDGTYTVIFAEYDNGRLLSVNAQDIPLVKGENPPISPQNFNANGKVKVMLWDSLKGMKPLCSADEN